MTIAFWVLAANLIIIALLIIVLPIWFRRDINIGDNQQHNLEIGRQKLTELKNLRDNQILSESEYEEQLNELELALDDELSQAQKATQAPPQGRWIVALIVPLLPISAIVIYLTIGTPKMIDTPNVPQHKQAAVVTNATTSKQPMDISNMLAQLLERLKQNPEDGQGWFMLGRTYKYLNEYDKAVDAFAEANKLQNDNVDILLQYADALIMSRNGRMDGKASELVFKALAINPEDTTGLWLAGMVKAGQGDFTAAIEYWLKLEPLIANDAKSTIELQRLIVEARAKIDQQAPVVKSEQTQFATVPPSQIASAFAPALTVRVQLSADIQSQASPTDTVFIYAQALQGMRIPLAILRKQVKDLPITVTLSDAESMTPMAKLSGHEQVKILARISKAGSAMPQTGDLLGTVTPVQVSKTETIQLIISQVLE